ncbi:MAG: polysaccharide pyruvyl transferase family protein [Rhodocyclaceae bacterium]|nr:polysaccharide pyruvyl transferase family protein [Rhodocyclaceae bacterium]
MNGAIGNERDGAAGKVLQWRVLIANAWGGNRGDEAMLNTLNRLLKSITGEVSVSVLPFRNEDLDIDADMRVERSRIGEYWYAEIPRGMHSALNARVPRKLARIVTTTLHRAGSLADESLVRPYDLILSAPQGPTLGDMYSAKERIVEPLRLAQRVGKPYMILAVSAGPFEASTASDGLVQSVLQGASRIVVREEVSLGHLRQKFPSLANVEAAIDIVYASRWSLTGKPEPERRAYEDFMADIGGDAVGVCISMTPARKPTNPFDREAYLRQFCALMDHVLSRSAGRLLLFPHLAFDMPALEQIRAAVSQPQRVSILPPNLDSDFQRDAISRTGFFISSRYHPTIFAIQAGVPFMCIKNQFKVEGMMEKIGLGAIPSCWQDESLDRFKDTFDACWRERDGIRSQVRVASEQAGSIASIYREVLARAHREWLGRMTDGDMTDVRAVDAA